RRPNGDGHGRLVPLDDTRVARDELDAGRAAASRSSECTHDDARDECEREEALGCGGGGHSSGRRSEGPTSISLPYCFRPPLDRGISRARAPLWPPEDRTSRVPRRLGESRPSRGLANE